jgi:hypothetical protein
MRLSTRCVLVGTIAVTFTILWCCHTRTEVAIAAIDDGYDIRITRYGRWMLPISPEGMFPAWSDGKHLLAGGDSTSVTVGGVRYKKYPLRIGLWSESDNTVVSGAIYVSEEGKKLIVEGGPTILNGRYDYIKIEHPKIIPLTAKTRIEDINGCFVRATGCFKGWDFETAGRSLYTNETYGNYGVGIDEAATYEVIGIFRVHDGVGRDEPGIRIVRFKRVSAER